MKFSITEYAKCPPVTEMEKSARLVDGIVNNTPFHSNSLINQMLPQIIHILHFF